MFCVILSTNESNTQDNFVVELYIYNIGLIHYVIGILERIEILFLEHASQTKAIL